MKISEIMCPDCKVPHRLLAEAAAFEGQPTIAPTEYPLAAKYAEFNRRFWGGQLPQVPMGFSRMKGLGGKVTYKVARAAGTPAPNATMVRLGMQNKFSGAQIVPGTLKLQLSADFRRPEDAFDAILLHEMIHVEMAVAGEFAENHGPKFLARAQKIGSEAGFPVPAVCPSDWFAVPVNVGSKRLGLLLLRKKDGSHTFAIVPEAVAKEATAEVAQRWSYFVQHGYVENATLWSVGDPAWNAIAQKVPVQRMLGPKTKFFVLKDETPLADLQRDGQLLVDVRATMGQG